MSTRSVVDEIKVKAADWDEEGSVSICAMLNRAQNKLFSKPCSLSIFRDPDTGDYPYLVTQDTVYDYEIPDFTREVDGVDRTFRIAAILEVFSRSAITSDYLFTSRCTSALYVSGNEVIYRGKAAPALQNTGARWMFKENPGSESTKYQYRGLIEPLQITAVSIPLSIPQDWEAALIDGALGYIEHLDYGRSDRLTAFLDRHCPEFWAAQESYADEERPTQTPIRKA